MPYEINTNKSKNDNAEKLNAAFHAFMLILTPGRDDYRDL